MKATRLGAAKRDPSRASSRTNSGTTRSARGGGGERRVVVDAEVAVEEDDGGLHIAYIARMAEKQSERPSGRDETDEERLDRNLGELLQELRVALPGVQVLFAFLLAVPFQQNFTKITEFEKRRLLRDPAADRALGGAADRPLGLPPADLPLPAEAPARLRRQPAARSPASPPWRWR